jgi:alcohol dehydrogenase (cytochrome c)
MKLRVFLLLSVAGLVRAQNGPVIEREAPVTSVPFERILNAAKEPQNWLTYSGGYASNRYSELTKITPENVKDLSLKWVYQSRSLEKHEVTPLVVDGVMYTIQSPNDVVALDAVTGKSLWTHTYKNDPEARNCCGQMTRGLAILGDKLFLATLDAHMIALNAKTGKEIWNVAVAEPKEKYSFTHAPLVIKDKVIEGTAGGEFGIRGFIAAFDVNTGKEAWRFYTVPGPGEPGHETWAGDSWKHGGAPLWVTGSYDPQTNLTFWGVGNPGPDWNGDGRLGDNLYSCSVIALDADTGKLKWHFQFSPHNEFDWDSVQIPVLADIQWKGKPRKAMLWANRSGMFYVLDRTTGEFLLGKPFVKVNWATGFDEKGRPIRAAGAAPSKEGTLIYPGNQGATNWYSPSYSPKTGLFYIPSWQNSSTTYVKDEEPPDFHSGKTFSGAFPKGGNTSEEIYSEIQAFDPSTGEKKWGNRLSAPSTEAGILTTASNVLFSGGRDGAFYALDARDGKMLWQTSLGPSVSAGAMTFSVGGKQYVSIQAGAALFTFGLRE